MSLTNIEIPESLFQRVKQLASEHQVTVDQFINTAIAEKTATLDREGYISTRSARADSEEFASAVASIPDTEPEKRDRL